MTDKIVLTSAGSGYNLSTINDNFQKIETALNDRVMFRDVQTGEVNSVLSDVDVNGKRLYNLPVPIDLDEAARLRDVQDAVSGATAANLISADDGSSGSIFTTVQGFITKILSNIGSSLVGFAQAESGAVNRTTQAKLRDHVSALDLGVVGSVGVDDRAAIIAAFETCAAAGRILIFPKRTYECSNWIPIPSNLKVWCEPGATFKLTGNTSQGGFFIGGRHPDGVGLRNCDNVDIANISLDINSLAGENGLCFINANGARIYNPQIVNTVHSPTTLGGRAVQIEGGIATGVSIWNPYIENCSIGINFQADSAAGTKRVVDFNVFGVSMRDVDIPFNVDCSFANPQNGIVENMSGTIQGATLWNCGRISWPGHSGATGGGIICGDRGFGLRVNDLRVVNETAYGGIGALIRGRVYGIELHNARIDVPSMTAVFDFTEVGFGGASASATNTTAFTSDISVKSNLDYIVKGSTGGIGAARLQCSVAGATASLAGLVDTNAAASTTSLCTFENSDDGVTTGLVSLKTVNDSGNSFTNFAPPQRVGFRTFTHSKSLTDETATQFFKVLAPIHSRLAIFYNFSLMYPSSTNDAAVRTETGLIAAVVDGVGNGTTNVKVTDTNAALDAVVSQTITVTCALVAGEIIVSVTQNNENADAPLLCMGTFDLHYSVGSTASAPTITRL